MFGLYVAISNQKSVDYSAETQYYLLLSRIQAISLTFRKGNPIFHRQLHNFYRLDLFYFSLEISSFSFICMFDT